MEKTIEKTPLLLMRFTSHASNRLIGLVEDRLLLDGIRTLSHLVTATGNLKHPTQITLVLSCTHRTLEEEAESNHLIKPTTDQYKIFEHFTVKERQQFIISDADLTTTTLNDSRMAVPRYISNIFSPSECLLLISRRLDRVAVVVPGQTKSNLASQLEDEFYVQRQQRYEHNANNEFRVRDLIPEPNISTESLLSRSTSGRTDDASFRRHDARGGGGGGGGGLRNVLESYNVVDTIVGAPLPEWRQEIFQQTWYPWWKMMPPIHQIQQYYGWEVAYYFAWMGFLTRWLVVPGILGLFTYIYRWHRNESIDDDEYTPFYGLITFLWAVLMSKFWLREESRLALRWGTYTLSAYEHQHYLAIRSEFRGFTRISPVTGKMETYYPRWFRCTKYVVNAIVTGAMLAVAFTVMILSLNMQGYINPKTNPNRWKSRPHPFYVESLANLAEKGHIFDASSFWKPYFPVILHVACIFTLNNIYRRVAEVLTKWENHESEIAHRNSLILKRFLFEAFDCYVALFYLAFYERDVDRLRDELVSVFQLDTVRRILLECVVPMLLQRMHHTNNDQRSGEFASINVSALNSAATGHEEQLLETLERDDYEQFDDFMEILIQIGYVTLFASAYPLASLISVVANMIEIRSDMFKLARVCRRPYPPLRSSGLGMWRIMLQAVIWSSALTNCLIAGFTSDQLQAFMPSYYVEDETTGFNIMGHEKGWLIVFVIFGLEHCLLVMALLISALIPDVPEEVTDELERQHFVRVQSIAQKHSEQNTKKDQ